MIRILNGNRTFMVFNKGRNNFQHWTSIQHIFFGRFIFECEITDASLFIISVLWNLFWITFSIRFRAFVKHDGNDRDEKDSDGFIKL